MKYFGFYSAFWALLCLASPVFGQAEKAALEGLVLDGATRQPVAEAVVSVYNTNRQMVQSHKTGFDGGFRVGLSAKEAYQIIVQARDYVNSSEFIDFSDPRVTSRVGKTIYLTKTIPLSPTNTPTAATLPPPVRQAPTPAAPPVAVVVPTPPPARPKPSAPVATRTQNIRLKPTPTPPPAVVTPPKPPLTITEKPIEIRPIFFAQSTAEVLPESRESLDMLLKFLAQNPTIVVELTGHTDNQGDFDQNVALSKQRADVVRNYLLGKGIVPAQVRTRGYGATRPALTNNYEKNRPFNRRVEITIVKE